MMCTGTILQFKIPRVVVGEARSFEGNLDMLVGAGVEVILLDHQPSVDLMAEFTTRYPEIWAEDIAESSD
jgi:cytosine deaminase